MLALFFGLAFTGRTQEVENDFQTRTEVKLSVKPLKNLEFSLTPMLRFNDNLVFDQYLLEGELVYKPVKNFSFGAAYRYIGNQTNKNGMENYGRYTFFAEAEKKWDRFKPSVKLSYTNYADDDANDTYLRYKTGLEYNIPKSKLTPEISVEAFHDLTNSNFHKIRYSAGLNYKLFKNNSISLGYKYDYYLQDFRNKHIAGIGYKIKF